MSTLPALPQDETSLLSVISRAASDERVDVAKMQALLDMGMQLRREEARQGWHDAMARLQPLLPRITKNGQILDKAGNVRSTYAPIEDIDLVTRPLYTAEGFSVRYTTDLQADILYVTCHVSRGGHTESNTMPVPVDRGNFGNSAAQGMAITRSYGRRLSFCDAFNIITVDEDKDGQAPAPTITDKQILALEDLIHETKANLPNLLRFAKVNALAEIRQGSHFDRVLEALERKRNG